MQQELILMDHIKDESGRFSGNAIVSWKTRGELWTRPAESSLLDEQLFDADAFRKPTSYPRQRNYYGLYFFSQIDKHIWHESINEANMFMLLDHTEDITAFASQPMEVKFADGRRHVPDAIALLGSSEQVVYDIKPASKITPTVVAQFAKTQAVCDAVGWGYRVLPGLPDQVLRNLTWFGQFRHPHFRPAEEAVSRLLGAADEPMPFDEAASILVPSSIADARASLSHLLWTRQFRMDMTARLNNKTLVEKTRNV
jgi:hypothetical protein